MGDTMSEQQPRMMRCPRCHEGIRRWVILGINLGDRTVFAVIVTVALLAFDVWLYWDGGGRTHIVSYRHVIALTFAGRLVFAYFCVYPYLVHYVHRGGKGRWNENALLGLMVPVLMSMDFLVRVAGEALGVLGPYGTSRP